MGVADFETENIFLNGKVHEEGDLGDRSRVDDPRNFLSSKKSDNSGELIHPSHSRDSEHSENLMDLGKPVNSKDSGDLAGDDFEVGSFGGEPNNTQIKQKMEYYKRNFDHQSYGLFESKRLPDAGKTQN